ncbi:coiled-coil domain-containing protein 89 [Melopsittacus undulatus]|uniref:coiled-coil domain-containing protein 89 n=1 Tax=Melopsittacus undulatus TaxID=13146 RepID=UPI00146F3E59|nr:coiled-coil domain-containing protein 89 [Melopsittacus undulatus]
MAQNGRKAAMANSTSDSKMRQVIEDLTKGLKELCGSLEDEKSEKALLQSQLEQHHLICMLKKKVEDAYKQCRGLEQQNVALEKLRREDAVKMKAQTQQIQCLERCFKDLADNHEKMIQLKDEHREQNIQLQEENKRLRQENQVLFGQAMKEKEAEVLQLAAQARKLSEQLDSLQEKCAYETCRAQEREEELLEAKSQQASAYTWELDSLKHHLQCLQEQHEQTLAKVKHMESQQRAQDSELRARLQTANEEKKQLLNLATERGKALQDKQQEIQQLWKKLETAEKAKRKAEKRMVKEAAAADSELKVQELQQELESSKQAYNELALHFNAYRKHSEDLLTKEKALNVKLRHLLV